MTSQFDFSNSEWNDIAVLPVLVGYAIAMAEDSGFFGSQREMRTLAHSIAERSDASEARSLIDAVTVIDVKDKIEAFEGHAPDILGDVAVRSCGEIVKLLADRATPAEADGYQAWVFGIAKQVANAAKEHGVRVSEPEAALLARLRAALSQT